MKLPIKFPWDKPIYYTNPDGIWDFMPAIHRPGSPRFLHDDLPWPFNKIPRTWTSFRFVEATLLSGNPQHWVNRNTLEQKKGEMIPYGAAWLPKPWGLPGTTQVTRIVYVDVVSGRVYNGIYRSKVTKSGIGTRSGPRLSDDDDNGRPAFYVNAIPRPFGFLTAQVKRIRG